MLLTVALLSKGSLLGSLINKCRPASVANISLSSRVSASSRSLEQRAGMPPRPKKPLTPFFRFMQEQRVKLQVTNPNLSVTDVVKHVSTLWQKADNTLKERLQEEYKKDKQQYIEKRIKYDAKITDEQRTHLKELKQDITDAKERRMIRNRVKELGRPKKPASAFLKFIAKERLANPQKPTQTFREWHQEATAKWSTFTEEDKRVYMQESRIELDKYRKDMTLWEEKMIRMGNIDVVRHSNLIDPPEPKSKKH